MKNIFIVILVTLITLFSTVFYVLNYVPLSALDLLTINDPQFGTTLTDLNSTDTMSDFPTLYNANNDALNAGKVEVSTTTMFLLTSAPNLTTVGTITSGTWTGTAISVTKGGMGTTSPALYRVLLGNAASGITMATTTGTFGQIFTSNGTGAFPSWKSASFDTTQNYTNTGAWTFNTYGILVTASSTFNAPTTIAASDVSTSPLVLNNISYRFPLNQNASSSILMTDNSGNLTWEKPFLGEFISSVTATTTAAITAAIPTGAKYVEAEWSTGAIYNGVMTLWLNGGRVSDKAFGEATITFTLEKDSTNIQLICTDGGAGDCALTNKKIYFYR